MMKVKNCFGNCRKKETMFRFRSKTFLSHLVGMPCGLVLFVAALVACGRGLAQGPAATPISQAPAQELPTSVAAGAELFERLNCIQCHRGDGRGPGPSLVGVYGQSIALASGETVIVDDQYIRTSILDPNANVHAGYTPIMPSYAGRVSEEELSLLVEYIRWLGEN
jgi:mono/diheme cytochrome c family protein